MHSWLRQQYTTEFLNKLEEVLNKKGNDYASETEAFSNFENSSQLLGIPIEKVFLHEITKKVSRIVELLGKPAACESMLDSVMDIAGYACLMENYLRGRDEEKRNQKAGQPLGEACQGTCRI